MLFVCLFVCFANYPKNYTVHIESCLQKRPVYSNIDTRDIQHWHYDYHWPPYKFHHIQRCVVSNKACIRMCSMFQLLKHTTTERVKCECVLHMYVYVHTTSVPCVILLCAPGKKIFLRYTGKVEGWTKKERLTQPRFISFIFVSNYNQFFICPTFPY